MSAKDQLRELEQAYQQGQMSLEGFSARVFLLGCKYKEKQSQIALAAERETIRTLSSRIEQLTNGVDTSRDV